MLEDKKLISEILKLAGVDVTNLIENGLLEINHVKNWIIKRHYYTRAKTGRTYTDIKNELSVEYEVSTSAIEKIIYKKVKTKTKCHGNR